MTSSSSSPPPSAELLYVSRRHGGNGQRRSSRKVTPTLESRSPTELAVIVKPGQIPLSQTSLDLCTLPNPLRWQVATRQTHIDARFIILDDGHEAYPLLQASPPHGSPGRGYEDPAPGPLSNPLFQDDRQQSFRGRVLQSARHVILPFDLRTDPSALWAPENMKILHSIFPQTNGFGTDGFFLYIFYDPLPPKPWPSTVAGLPIYITHTANREFTPVPNAYPAYRGNGSIGGESDLRGTSDWKPLFFLLRDHFYHQQVSVTEIMYCRRFVLIVLEHRDTDTSKLPWKAAKVSCRYLFEDEMGRPSTLLARRKNEPTPGNPDQAVYDSLQPGLRISSDYIPGQPCRYYSTTTGVLVQDQNGNEFMTVAAHGFPSDCGPRVLHPLPADGRGIGEVVHEIPHTDVALVKLRAGETFRNISFTGGYIQEPVQLRRLVQASSVSDPTVSLGDIFIDSPDTGCIDGTLMWPSYQRLTGDVNEPEQHWVHTVWYYMDQGNGANLPDGICGSAMWTEKGDVIGFFRYAPVVGSMVDWCCGISSAELIQRGYSLVDTSGR